MSFAFAAIFSLGLVGLTSGCSEGGNSSVADRDELAAYLEEHPEALEEARELEEQWEPGYVEPDGEGTNE
ncbi:hypothetical protein SAMN06265222_12729 [Neorhodopirellula lusitana]|uniref:Secreted protein n=2 Tax=Neorhodopirellula lusitana TaxID=445327 RepID=A0ABY1QV91_9BACT|nr:hypothetical protein SAMN06265222_12729 [Neorhodopirellula lusitana]